MPADKRPGPDASPSSTGIGAPCSLDKESLVSLALQLSSPCRLPGGILFSYRIHHQQQWEPIAHPSSSAMRSPDFKKPPPLSQDAWNRLLCHVELSPSIDIKIDVVIFDPRDLSRLESSRWRAQTSNHQNERPTSDTSGLIPL